MTTSRTGTLVIQSARCSTRSRSVSSAHWRSSSTTTTGPSVASRSTNRRTAQTSSSFGAGADRAQGAASRRSSSASASGGPARRRGQRVADGRRVVPVGRARRPFAGARRSGSQRDPVAVGQAAAAQDRRPRAHAGEELVDEPALADPGRPEDRHEHAGLLLDGPLERRGQRDRARAPGRPSGPPTRRGIDSATWRTATRRSGVDRLLAALHGDGRAARRPRRRRARAARSSRRGAPRRARRPAAGGRPRSRRRRWRATRRPGRGRRRPRRC